MEPGFEERYSPGDLEERSHWDEGRASGGSTIPQLNGSDSKGPDITAGVIGRVELLFTSNHL
uniref:Uncharacterized protein n=1 Tax=Anguilla anguilla TaxID=7936 RepID=A0A0E9P6J0_ANGAN